MNRKLLIFFLGSFIVGCANQPAKMPDIPMELAQKPSEKGTLPVGRVIFVGPPHPQGPYGRTNDSEGVVRSPFAGPTAKEIILPYIIPPLALAVAPVVLTAHALGKDTTDKRRNKKEGSAEEKFDVLGGHLTVHTHLIELTGTNERVVRDELWRYKIGDCVALRSNPDVIVPALPGLCGANN